MSRPTFAVFVGASLDGFIARKDGALDWLKPFEGVDHGYAPFFEGIDTLLVGRGTWDTVAAFPEWPYPGKRVAVLTHRPLRAAHGELVLAGAPAEVAARLESEGARRVYLDGGATISGFLAAGLVDELTVSVLPVVLGDGLRLFVPPLPERALALQSSQAYPDGVVQLRYRSLPG
jgi:dihydrofolate reductase